MSTVLDNYAPHSLRNIITHNSSPCFESIRDELFIAKREKLQAERKWRNANLAAFKDLCRQAKHKASILVHTAKCKFYSEWIALASSRKDLHQIFNTLSNRHPHNILPTIYHRADLHSIFIKHLTIKVEKLRAKLLLNMLPQHLFQLLLCCWTTTATFSSFVKVSQSRVKECILISAPESCYLDLNPSKVIVECLDSILPSHTDLLSSSLVSGITHNASSQLLSHLFSKRGILIIMIWTTIGLCLIYSFLLRYWKHLSYPKFLPSSTLTIFTVLVNQHIAQVTALKQLFWELLMICSFLLTKATYLC